MKARIPFLCLIILMLGYVISPAQDTVRISYQDFISAALANSGKLKYEQEDVNIAENRIDQAEAQRIFPKLSMDTQHGWVPAVKSDSVLPWGKPLPKDEYYLDPDLRNDWSDWAFYNKFEISGLQPVFTWGSINTAIDAARKGAEAARYEFQAKEDDMEVRLFDLYYSYVLALEIERLLDEAEGKIQQIDNQIATMREEGDENLDDSEVFKFEIFKSEFDIQKAQAYKNLQFVKETWAYVLRNEEGTVYEPQVRFLDPVASEIEGIDFYQRSAFNNRPELKALAAGEEATKTYISSLRKKNLPGLYLGGYMRFAHTPNRPRQDNPFIFNNTNLFTGGFGFTIRQNLNFFSIKASIERSKIELRKVDYAQDAAQDGILLEVNNNYRTAAVAEVKVTKTDEALVTAKKWLRQEQLDYDFGMGDVKDLTDAMKKELELKLQLKRNIFELNSSLAKLNKSAGIPLNTLITN